MAHYQYEGVHYELPDGLSNEDAIKKIETHLGRASKQQPKEQSSDMGDYLSKVGKSVAGVAEAGLNLAGGVGGMFVAPVAAGLGAMNNLAQGKPMEFEKQYADVMGKAGTLGTTLADATGLRSNTGDSLNAGIGEVMNQVGIPAGGVAHSIPVRVPALAEFGVGSGKNIPIPKSASDKLNKLKERTEPTMDTVKSLDDPEGWQPPASYEPKFGSEKNVPQAIKDQQAIYNRVKEQTDRRAPVPEPDTLTQELPFAAGPDEVIRNQYREDFTNPDGVPLQRDMFAEQDLLAQDKDPYAENLQKQAEIDSAYAQRQAEADAATAAENTRRAEADKMAEQQRAQELRDQIYQPLEDSLKQRTSKGQKRKAMNRQRGAIDVDAIRETIDFFKRGFMNDKDVFESFKGTFHPDELARARKALADPKSRDTVVLMSPDEFHQMAAPRSGEWMTGSDPAFSRAAEKQFAIRIALKKDTGLANMPYLMVDKNGKVKGHEGRHRMDVFKEQGIEVVPVRIHGDTPWGEKQPPMQMIAEGKSKFSIPFPDPLNKKVPTVEDRLAPYKVPFKQRGALTFGKGKEVVALDENNPDVVSARSSVTRAETAKALMGTDEGFRSNIDTPAKVVAAVLDGAKDISKIARQRGMTITGGSNRLAGQTNHPLIKFTRDSVRKSLRDSENVMRQFVTNKDGLGGMWQRMSQAERNEVMGAWKHGDEIQQKLTPEQLRESGFSEGQIEALQHIYKMQDFLFERTNEAYVYAGLDPIRQRPGHMPGIFKGDYRSLVMKRDGVDKAGKPIWKPVQYFSADTKWQHAPIRKKVENMFQGPGYMIKDIEVMPNSKRVGLAGEMQVLIDLLGHNDKAFAEVQAKLKEISAESAAKLYGAHLHAKEKIGIGGNEGNKFWKSVNENTNEGMKAYLQYYEDTIASHNLLKTEVDLNGLLNNPVLDTQPNAKAYVNDYMRNVQGRSLGDVGQALDTLLTKPFDVLGIGESGVRAGVHQITKRLGQKAMGYFNIPFTAMQLVQVAQTGLPEIIGLKGNAELTGVQAAKAMKEASVDAMVLLRDAISHTKTSEPSRRAMFDYAEANGLLNFSEFADVNKVTQSKLGERFDFWVDMNRVVGEVTTRPLVFFTFVRMLEKSGLPKNEVFDMAYNKTQYAMVDYTPPEIPMLYNKLGMVGKAAGTLKTFQHAFSGQQLDWLNRFRKGDMMPLVVGGTMGILFAGVTGMAGYQEADQIFQYITDKMGKRQTIREAALSNLYGWAQNGVLSDMTNINLQSRLGQANLLPESLVDAVSPYASSTGDMLGTAAELVKDPNAITATNAAKAWAPSSLRGPIENIMSRGDVLRDASGMPTGMTYTKDKEGRNDYPRDERDWKLRLLGLTSMEESLYKEKLYNDTLANMSDKDARAKIMTYMLRGFRTQDKFGVTKDFAALKDKYIARGGDPNTLLTTLQKEIQEGKKSRKQRLEGIPNGSIGSIHNYESYNK